MAQKRGQTYAGNAAAFVAVITVLIILYILFLPPDIRTELLGDKNAVLENVSGSSGSTIVLLKENVGLVTFINTNEKTYDIPSTRIYSPTAGQVLKSIPSIALRYAIFDSEKSKNTVEFTADKTTTKNVLLSFSVRDHNGPISITLNGKEIFSGEISAINPKPIALNQEDLMSSNILVLSVPSPGLRFWSANKYTIETLQVTGDVTDYSNAASIQHFVLSKTEKDNLESLKLFFYPGCDLKTTGRLRIDFNGEPAYNGVADCGSKTFTILDISKAIVGSNELRFSSTEGSYLLDNIYVQTTMTKPTYNTYYFDLSTDYFGAKDTKARCGDYDGICPAGCDETQDADCCFDRNGYWCSLPTQDVNNRCRFYLASDNCATCKTGYYDGSGDAPKNCENVCGDNNDGKCLSDCPQPDRYYDKDCCFAQNPDNFWCKETPITGITDKCKPDITPNDCDSCPSGYINSKGATADACNQAEIVASDSTYVMLNNYELKVTVRFTDATTRKRVDINVNGHTFRIDTTAIEYAKVINSYANIDTNSIEIIPVDDDVNIAEIKVELRQIT
jgi:hypothetical protein